MSTIQQYLAYLSLVLRLVLSFFTQLRLCTAKSTNIYLSDHMMNCNHRLSNILYTASLTNCNIFHYTQQAKRLNSLSVGGQKLYSLHQLAAVAACFETLRNGELTYIHDYYSHKVIYTLTFSRIAYTNILLSCCFM